MKPQNKTYFTLILESTGQLRELKAVPIGTIPTKKIHEFQQHGQRSSLWSMITALIDTQYQNDRLVEIQARGAVLKDWQADYQAPALRSPAIVGYGPAMGILSHEVWS